MTSDVERGVGERLRWARVASGITSARELDRLAGFREGRVWMIETGRRQNMETEAAIAICAVLGITLEWLLLGTGRRASARALRAAVERARSSS